MKTWLVLLILILCYAQSYAGSREYRAHGAGQSKHPQTTVLEQVQFNHWLRHMNDQGEPKEIINYPAYQQTPPSLVKPNEKKTANPK
jgi:hypothetical protein